jgi:hypothetical protein
MRESIKEKIEQLKNYRNNLLLKEVNMEISILRINAYKSFSTRIQRWLYQDADEIEFALEDALAQRQ